MSVRETSGDDTVASPECSMSITRDNGYKYFLILQRMEILGWVQNEDRRPKTQKWRPRQNRLEITWNHLKSLEKGSNIILDQSRNKEQQDLQLSTNLTRVFVLYITPLKVQNEDPVKIVLKSLEITWKRLEHDSRPKQKQGATRFAFMNKFDQGLRFVHNPTKSTKWRPLQNPHSYVIRMYPNVTRMLLVCILMYPYVPCVMTFSTQTILGYQQTIWNRKRLPSDTRHRNGNKNGSFFRRHFYGKDRNRNNKPLH